MIEMPITRSVNMTIANRLASNYIKIPRLVGNITSCFVVCLTYYSLTNIQSARSQIIEYSAPYLNPSVIRKFPNESVIAV